MKHVPFKDAGTIKVNFQEATPMKPRQHPEEYNIPDHVIKVLCEACREMSTIRARRGIPVGSSITQEYWDDIISRLDKIVQDETGHSPHAHPSLYGN